MIDVEKRGSGVMWWAWSIGAGFWVGIDLVLMIGYVIHGG